MIDPALIQDLFQNAGTLALCALALLLLAALPVGSDRPDRWTRPVAVLVFPAMTACLILFSAVLPVGSTFDARAAPALLAGVFGGIPAALASALAGAAVRLWVGGPFALGGAASVVVYCAVGLLAGLALRSRDAPRPGHFVLLGAVGSLAVVPTFFVGVAPELGLASLRAILPLLLPVNVVAVTILGLAYRAGLQLLESRERMSLLQNALKHTENGILLTVATPDLTIVYANDAIRHSTGYTAEELVGISPRIFNRGLEDQPGLDRLRLAIARREPCAVELINRTKDGTEFVNHLSVSPVENRRGQVTHFVGIQDDVTALRQTEHLVHMVTDRLPLALAFVGLDGRVKLANAAFRARYACAPGEAEGRTLEEVVGPVEHARLHTAAAAAFAGETVMREIERPPVETGGRPATIRETLYPAYTSRASVLSGFVWVQEDITRKRAAEDELRQAHKMRSIGDLTGGIAHDFNNLNAVVIGNLELLEETAPKGEAATLVTEALNAAYRSADLTRSLLSFARRAPLHPRVVDASAHMASLSGLLRASVPESAALSIAVSDKVSALRIDPGSFDNAVLNLVLNARDAIGRKGGEIRVTAEVRTLAEGADDPGRYFAGDLTELPAGAYLVVSVADNGRGVAEEMRARMFEPFATTKGVQIGNGLGLAMVHGFVNQSGGIVRARDREGGGTVIEMIFPDSVLIDGAVAGALAPAPTLRVTGRPTALVVEDEGSVRRLLVRRMTGLGFAVVDFDSADEARLYLERAGPPEVLLTDAVLTGHMQGTDLARMVKARWPDTRVILASGYPYERLPSDGRDAHDVFMAKPFTQDDLLSAVRACVPGERLISTLGGKSP